MPTNSLAAGLHVGDDAIMAVYVAACLSLGFIFRKSGADAEDYLLAGHRMPWWGDRSVYVSMEGIRAEIWSDSFHFRGLSLRAGARHGEHVGVRLRTAALAVQARGTPWTDAMGGGRRRARVRWRG